MSEDAGTATASPDAGAQPQTPDAGSNGVPEGAQDHSGAPVPGVDDQSPEALLAAAVESGDSQDSGEATGADELKAAKAEAEKWRKQARENEKRAKANAEKAKNFDAYTESQKTEQQKLADAAKAAEERAIAAEGTLARTMAAAQYDLPPDMIDDLRGSTQEEINASAERLARAINERAATMAAAAAKTNGNGAPQQYQQQGGQYRPVESLRPGALPASDNQPLNPETWLRRQIDRR